MKEFTGKDSRFRVLWLCSEQTYFVYKNGALLLKLFRFSDVKNYLN